jgi:hypothetical protein
MNDLVNAYRKTLADQGLDDPRDDYIITQQLGDIAQKENPQLFDQFPTFAQQWDQIRNANAPSLPSEFGRAARASLKGLGSTALGGLSLLTGSDYLKEKAQALDQSAAADAPTIGSLEDIAPGQSTSSKVFSRDAVRYGLSKLGGAIPSIGEAIGLGVAGGLVGSALEPGVGTLAGAAEGVTEGVLGRGVIKNAIKSLLAKGEGEGAKSVAELMAEKGLLTDTTEAGISNAIRAGKQEVADIVSAQARQIAGRRAAIGAETLNSYLLNSGEIYNETPDRGLAAGLGVLSAIPDTILPAFVIAKLFPNLTGKAATAEAKAVIGSTVTRVGKKLGLAAAATAGEGATEWFQEGVDIVARNLKEGKPAMTFTDDDLKRMREAGIAGAAGGLIAAPGILAERTVQAEIGTPKTEPAPPAGERNVPLTPAQLAEISNSDQINKPLTTAEINAPTGLRALARLTDEQKVGRLQELTALTTRSPEQESEYQVLRATVKLPEPTGAEIMAAPAQPTPEPDIRVTIQEPQVYEGRTIPGVVAIERTTPEGRGEPLTAEERAKYPSDQDLIASKLHGQFTMQQVLAALAAAPEKLVEQVAAAPEAQPPVAPPAAPAISASATQQNEGTPPLSPARETPAQVVPEFKTRDDILNFRRQKIEEEIQLYQREIGLDRPEAERLQDILARDGDTAKFEKKLTPEKQAKLTHFFEESQFNKKGGPFDFWEFDKGYNPESIAPSDPIEDTARGLVQAISFKGVTENPLSDKFVFAALSAKQLQDRGATLSDIARAVDGYSTRNSGSQSEKTWAFREIGAKVKAFLESQGVNLPQGDLGTKIGGEPSAQTLNAPAEPTIAPGAPIVEIAAPFKPGAVIEGGPTIDFRTDERFKALTPEQWRDALRANMDMGVRSGGTGNRTETRIAVALEAPDGRVIKTGLILPQRTLLSTGATANNEPSLQRMGVTRGGKRLVEAGGNQPATVSEAVAAGFKPIAVIHFDAEPTKIYQAFPNGPSFDRSWTASERSTGQGPKPAVNMQADITRSAEGKIQAQIDDLGERLLASKDPAEHEQLIATIKDLYARLESTTLREQQQLGTDQPPEYRRAPRAADAAGRTSEFQAVLGNLRALGARVDVFSREFMAQGIRSNLEQKIAAIQKLIAQAPTAAQKNELTRQLGILNERLQAVSQAAGVTYSPYHIAVSVDDIQQQSLNNLVTLLHEAAESLTQRLTTAQRGEVLRAVDKAAETLSSRARESAAQTGATLAKTVNAADALSESLAQQLAAAGVPDAPSLAQAIVRWVKDLYYRSAMAVQRAFGAEPSEELSLGWFENQLRREVFGDYSYALGSLIDRFLPEPLVAKTQKFVGHDGTPGNLTEFRDPISGQMTNPSVDPTTADALAWNIAFQTHDQPGKDLDIPDPEARARQQAAAINEVLRYATELHQQIGNGMPLEQFLRQMWPGTDPRALVQDLEKQFPGAGTAQIGGERMTDVMNQQALRWVRSMVTKAQQTAIRGQTKLTQEIEVHSAALSEAAKQMNRLEGDLRNAALHGDILKDKAREMTRQLIRAYSRGLDTAHTHGELAEAIRQAEDLSEADQIPEQYQRVLKSISDGEVNIFDYIKAIARLDLPIADLTMPEMLRAIKGNADQNETLRQLSENRPLMVAIANLALTNADQVDQIQLGWLQDATQFREIHKKLEEIRTATPSQLKQLISTMDERAGAKGLEERIKASYLKARRDLQRTNARLQSADERLSLYERAREPMAKLVAEVQRKGGGSYSEWLPANGAKFTAMRLNDEGAFDPVTRTLEFKPDGSAVNSDQVRSDIAQNRRWLEDNTDKAGEKFYEQVKRQTFQLAHLDVQRQYPAGWQAFGLQNIDKFVRTPVSAVRELGGAASARINQKFQRFQFIQRTYAPELEGPSSLWSDAQARVMKAAGMKDVGTFLDQVYDPVSYFLNSNPGLDEAAAIRKATAMARRLIPGEPAADFNEQFASFIRRTKELSEKVAAIAEQYGIFIRDPRIKGELRRALPTGWLTSMRSLRGALVQTVTEDMEKAGWKLGYRDEKNAKGETVRVPVRAVTFDSIDPVNAKTPEERKSYFDGLANTANLRGILQKLFPAQVVQRWLEPFINKPGAEPFSYGGRPIAQLDVQEAWGRANGDVVSFIDELSKSVKLTTDEKGADPLSLFRLSMLRQFDQLFGMEAKLAFGAKQNRDLFDPMGPRPNALMEARMNELIPPEHLSFQSFDPQAVHRLLGQLAFTGAFGRNGEGLIADFSELRGGLQGAKAQFDQLSGTTRGARAAEAAALGYDYKELERAAKRFDQAREIQNQVQAVFGVGNPAGPFADLRPAMTVLSGMAGQIVDNPKVGAYNLLSIAMRPFAMRSLGPMAMGDTLKSYGGFLHSGAGSLLENMGLHLLHASEYAKDVSASEGQVFRDLPYGVIMADQGNRGKFQTSKTDRWLIRPIQMLRNLQRKGVKIGVTTEGNEFPRMAAIPGLGVLNTISQLAAQGGATNLVQRLEKLVVAGVRHFEQNPDHAADPSYRLTAKDLGVGKLDAGVLDWFRNKTVEYGLGNLEDLAREAAPRQARAERLLTRDQALRVAQMNANELDGASSINTTPLMLQTNPVLKMLMPLLRWPLWMMHTAHEGLQTAEGKANFKSVAKGLGTLALWNLPMGLAFSMMLDEYDDKLLGKKSNSRGIDKIAAVPIIGPELALAFGDKTVGQNLLGFLERSAKAGNVYGLGADMLGQFAAPYDPNSGQRQFSLDQRVLVMSQFLNLQQSMRNLLATNGASTWANFWRPFMMSIGGNGALHSLDITNQLLGLDNQESRLVSRINAQNWLRSAGRELDIPLQTGGGNAAPSPLSVWTREMQLAAMGNDRLAFQEAYQKALNAARDAVGEDPNVLPINREREVLQRVLNSWRARDPRSVFATKVTPAQYQNLLGVMDDDGRADVVEAVRRYEAFTRTIAPTQFERQQQQSIRLLVTPQQARLQLSLSR